MVFWKISDERYRKVQINVARWSDIVRSDNFTKHTVLLGTAVVYSRLLKVPEEPQFDSQRHWITFAAITQKITRSSIFHLTYPPPCLVHSHVFTHLLYAFPITHSSALRSVPQYYLWRNNSNNKTLLNVHYCLSWQYVLLTKKNIRQQPKHNFHVSGKICNGVFY